jgi:segregation and condensation protein A
MFADNDQNQEPGTAYKISTPLYEGPLDLLLQLIENAELDITRLALVQVTGPFLAYVQELKEHKAEQVSSFLVVAARLMQIKSEALLPRPPEREPGEEDPGDELINQLITYKKFKEISQILKQRDEQGLRTFLRLAPPPKVESKLDMEDVTLQDLMAAARRALQLLEEKESVDTVVKPPKVTITEKITLITHKLRSEGSASFMTLLGENYSRVDVVVTFLALLELVKRFHIRAVQDDLFSDIRIEPTDDWQEDEEIEIEFIE